MSRLGSPPGGGMDFFLVSKVLIAQALQWPACIEGLQQHMLQP